MSFEPPDTLHITGTMINYYLVCPRKLWLFARKLGREADSDLVRLGLVLHEQSFPRKEKEILIMDRLKIDHTTRGENIVVHEVKSSWSQHRAARLQLLFYLREMKRLGVQCTGELHFRRQRRKERVVLDEKAEGEVEAAIAAIGQIVNSKTPPGVPPRAPCRGCSYRDYCEV
ncbi:MAG: CRISPR-associated protein Cas4 [Candidatus Thorarchaeota archaeon]